MGPAADPIALEVEPEFGRVACRWPAWQPRVAGSLSVPVRSADHSVAMMLSVNLPLVLQVVAQALH